jgi:hypothetical protein
VNLDPYIFTGLPLWQDIAAPAARRLAGVRVQADDTDA